MWEFANWVIFSTDWSDPGSNPFRMNHTPPCLLKRTPADIHVSEGLQSIRPTPPFTDGDLAFSHDSGSPR